MIVVGLALAGTAHARPYPSLTGISAAADSAYTTGTNPAGMTRLDTRELRVGVLGFFTDNTWEGQLGAMGPTVRSTDSSTTIVPSGNFVKPLKNDWYFGFTILGAGFSEDFDDNSPARYLMDEYTLVYVSAFPSIARKVTDKLSLAGSLALTYTNYEQIKAVPNVDPGFGDGRLEIEADDLSVGFSVSSLYDVNDKTRFGLVYRSEVDPDLTGNANFSGLGPTTEMILDAAGLLGAPVNIKSRQPQAINAGVYHEFTDGGALTFDVVWSDFSNFKLSEIYVNGDQLVDSSVNYDDIFAFSVGYSRPISERLMIGFGALYADDMVDDDERTILLRLDSLWAAGIGIEWQWKPTRSVVANLNYLQLGDAPVSVGPVGSLGSITGEYTDRGTIFLEVAVNFGASHN